MNNEYRLLPVALAPHIKDALARWTDFQASAWADVMQAQANIDATAPERSKPVTWPPVVWKKGPLAMPPEGVTVDVVPLGPERSGKAADGYVMAPHYRGYAALGTGQYLLNHSRDDQAPSLIISVATDAEKSGRVVGDERDNDPSTVLHPEAMAVRIDFPTVAGLDALENQLRKLRAAHFAPAGNSSAAPSDDLSGNMYKVGPREWTTREIANMSDARYCLASDVQKFIAAPASTGESLSDDEIVAILHKRGIDTSPSIYGFPELQVSATNVPGIRQIVIDCIAHLAAKESA